MSVLIEDKIASGTGSFVVPYFVFYYYINRLGFISFLAFILLPRTQRMFSGWRLLLFLLLFCFVHVYSIEKRILVNKFSSIQNIKY